MGCYVSGFGNSRNIVGRSVRLFGSFGRYAVSLVLARCRTPAGFFFSISLVVASALGSSRPRVYRRGIHCLAAGAIVPSYSADKNSHTRHSRTRNADRAIFTWSFRCVAAGTHMAPDCPFTGRRCVLDLPGSADCQLLSSREITGMRKFSIRRRSERIESAVLVYFCNAVKNSLRWSDN